MKAMARVSVVAVMVLLLGSAPVGATVVTFEEGLGLDRTSINTQYVGITFVGAVTGEPWLFADATANSYNISSWPTKTSWNSGWYWINDKVGAWTTESGGSGIVNFNNKDATYAQLNYCSAGNFNLEAYDASHNLLDFAVGGANRRYLEGNESGPSTLRVDAPSGQSIAYVTVHDTGNYWVVDNFETDASGIRPVIPEPASMIVWSIVGGLGLAGTLWRRKRKAA